MSTNPLENLETNIIPETKSIDVIVPTSETVEKISMDQIISPENVNKMIENIKAKKKLENPEIAEKKVVEEPVDPVIKARIEKDKADLLTIFNRPINKRGDQQSLQISYNNIKTLGTKEYYFLDATIHILKNSGYAKSKPFALTSPKTVYNMLTSVSNSPLLTNLRIFPWFEYRLLVLCLRFLLLYKLSSDTPYGHNLLEQFVIPLFFKNALSFADLTDDEEKNTEILKRINNQVIKKLRFSIKNDLYKKIHHGDCPMPLPVLLDVVDVKNPPALVTDSFVISLLLKDFYRNTKTVIFNTPKDQAQVLNYLEEINFLFHVDSRASGFINYHELMGIPLNTQFVNIPMSSLVGGKISQNAFSALVNVLDIFVNSYYIYLIQKLAAIPSTTQVNKTVV